mgnify:CR=1 FL=1
MGHIRWYWNISSKDCIVKVKGTPIFGGISNERKNKEDAKKTIYIEGYAVFGGIEIKWIPLKK